VLAPALAKRLEVGRWHSGVAIGKARFSPYSTDPGRSNEWPKRGKEALFGRHNRTAALVGSGRLEWCVFLELRNSQLVCVCHSADQIRTLMVG
jgi:hypothetical protein